ncbi:MAG: hypothetical protein ACTSPI_10750 [Candidatus Heimdallarchaeaceae archaeon]
MRYIISNWEGFEIDSSEFAVRIQSKDIPQTINTFLDSPLIESYKCRNIIRSFIISLGLAYIEDREKLLSIKHNEKPIIEFFTDYSSNINFYLQECKDEIEEKNRDIRLYTYFGGYDEDHIGNLSKKDIEYFEQLLNDTKGCFTRVMGENMSFLVKLAHIFETVEGSFQDKAQFKEIVSMISILLKKFAHLRFEFIDATVTFTRKDAEPEGTNDYLISLSGFPYTYWQKWYTQEELETVLRKLSRKASIAYRAWL